MGGYTSKCEKKSKSLHPTEQAVNTEILRDTVKVGNFDLGR